MGATGRSFHVCDEFAIVSQSFSLWDNIQRVSRHQRVSVKMRVGLNGLPFDVAMLSKEILTVSMLSKEILIHLFSARMQVFAKVFAQEGKMKDSLSAPGRAYLILESLPVRNR